MCPGSRPDYAAGQCLEHVWLASCHLTRTNLMLPRARLPFSPAANRKDAIDAARPERSGITSADVPVVDHFLVLGPCRR